MQIKIKDLARIIREVEADLDDLDPAELQKAVDAVVDKTEEEGGALGPGLAKQAAEEALGDKALTDEEAEEIAGKAGLSKHPDGDLVDPAGLSAISESRKRKVKVSRSKLRKIIQEELALEQSTRVVDSDEFDRAVRDQRYERGRDPIYQPRARTSGIRRGEDGRLSSFGTRIETADGITYRHDNIVLNDEGQWEVLNGASSFSPLEKLVIGATASASDRKTASAKPRKKAPPAKPKYQPRWPDKASVGEFLADKWFPKKARESSIGSEKGSYVFLVDTDGDGPWYGTPDVGGLDQDHFGRTGWGFWKMTKDGMYYTPKTPGGKVADLNNMSDPDIGFARFGIDVNLPPGYRLDSFNLRNMFHRVDGSHPGVGIEGDIRATGKGKLPDLDQVNKQKNQVMNQGDLLNFIRSVFRSGSASVAMKIPVKILGVKKKVKATFSAG